MTAGPVDSETLLKGGAGYFLYHSIGMFRDKARLIQQGLSEYTNLWSKPDDSQWPQALAIRQKFIDRWRALIHADAGTLTTSDNVTTALYSLFGSLPAAMLKGRRVLVAADCFPSLHFLLAGLAQRCGFILDTVPLRPGEAWVRDEDFLSQWNGDVAVALLTQCTSTASYRSDIASLVAHARSVGSLVGVDITQGVGLLPFDVRAPEVDFTVSTSLKWLGGTSGAGILHVRSGLLSQCSPELRGWFSQENPFSWALDAFEYASDARRFDHGTPSIVACAGTLPVLEWHAQQNQSERLAHNRRLASKIIAAADAMGLPLVSPREEGRRGGSVMIRLPASVDTREVIGRLRATGVYADCRGSTLRLSPGDLTTDAGVDRLFTNLRLALTNP
ncbi:aminotransferase class V-fold PLP-dependent enzyme [Steroidobacter sp.]|uniref:aminotransferase class V-fold PLP-dependent enzyme n=1 Tax=Steroidobacter sp. TaxID=1978227 RepID=UPI001A56EDF0|nr:aminotransferase class V-fold PLP-dependent enzyme [Steroidobacter sp.]MBL8265274.1 aminotransferase class V-fold PLP-dependent enzyme [Steroidobacter sp.]